VDWQVVFTHRGDEWAAQATTGAVRYDIDLDPTKTRWYLHASWRLPAVRPQHCMSCAVTGRWEST
jgi:hypothetical protein